MARIQLYVALVAAFALALSGAEARPRWHQLEGYTFERFVRDYQRSYTRGSEEYNHRRAVFENRLSVIRAHNANPAHTWKRGVNIFSDMTAEEWKAYNRGGLRDDGTGMQPQSVLTAPADAPLPILVDYRTWTSPQVLTPVRHQGSCGNCWAHSSTETIESHYAMKTGLLATLSVQQITACTLPNGCNGATATQAYEYVNSSYHGLTEEWVYPFSDFFYDFTNPSATTSKCINTTERFPNKTPYTWFAELTRVGVSGFVIVNPNDAVATQYALATTGPQSISVAAGNWQDYESGVFQNTNATGGDNEWGVDHDVQLVGYGVDKELGLSYWIVRNSWSTLWGEAGYIRLYRAANPADEPCSPAEYGPVCGTSGCLNDPKYPIVFQHPGQPF